MLSEFWEWLRTPAPRAVREMGYVYSTVALNNRFKRQKNSWRGHIENTHDLWRQLLQTHQPKTLCIVGSGPLSEAPMQDILAQVEHLILVDLVHPRAVLKAYKKNPKIQLVGMDVSGVVHWLSHLPRGVSPLQALDFQPPPWTREPVDLVVSANLLSQLSLEPVWFLSRRMKVSDQDERFQPLIARLGQQHLAWLRTVGRRAVLYTDTERRYLGPAGKQLEVHASRVPALPGEVLKHWTWTIAPLGEESKDYSVEMAVTAVDITNATE